MAILAVLLLAPVVLYAVVRWSVRDRCPWCQSARTVADADGLRRCVECQELFEPW